MKKKALAFALLLLVVGVTYRFFGSQDDLADLEQGSFATRLGKVQELDRSFREDLLEIRFTLSSTYDRLEANRRETEQTLASMQGDPDGITDRGRAVLTAWTADYRKLLETRQRLVERFESQNAVVMQSRVALPLAFGELIQGLGDSQPDRELAAAANQLARGEMAEMSKRNLLPNADNSGADLLQDWVTRHPDDPRAALATSAERHARILAGLKPQADLLIDGILSVPTAASLEVLSRLFQSEVDIALQREHQFRPALYVLGELLLAAIAYGFFASRAANRRLERHVQERTADLAGSEQRFRTLAAAAPIGIFLTDPAGNTLFTNPQWQSITGLSFQESLGNGWRRHLHPEDAAKAQADWTKMVDDGRQRNRKFRFLARGGEFRWVHARTVAVRSEQGPILGFVGTLEDITERKAAEEALMKANRELIDISRKAGMAEVATSVLHNVGNVLNSVNVSATLAIQQIKEAKVSGMVKAVALLREHETDLGAFFTSDARARPLVDFLCRLSERLLEEQAAAIKELEALRSNVDHIKQIVSEQQSFAKISGLKELLDVRELAEISLHMNADGLQSNGVQVVREFANVPAVEIEKHKVLQILVNLVCNAKIACTESGRADKRLTLSISGAGGRTQISVSDNGVGIAPENLTRIFGHGFTTRKDGHGFGLHSGALAARELGGSLTVHSDGPGKGATFTLGLPGPLVSA